MHMVFSLLACHQPITLRLVGLLAGWLAAWLGLAPSNSMVRGRSLNCHPIARRASLVTTVVTRQHLFGRTHKQHRLT